MIKKILTDLNPQKLFLILAFIFGFSFLIITPPFQVADENFHFYHAYIISEFYTNSNDGYETLPKCFVQFDSALTKMPFHKEIRIIPGELTSLINIKLNPDVKREPFINPASNYAFTLYIPQVIGIWTGRLLSLPPLIIFYLGRLFALLFWIYFVYIAIKITPVQKWVFILIALTPISLFQAVSFSSDCVINALLFLLVALILKYTYDNEKTKINKKDIFIVLLLSTVIIMSKPVFIILLLIFLLIPSYKFKSKSKFYFIFGSIIFINLLFVYIWNILVKTPINTGLNNTKTQFFFILSNPFEYFYILLNTFIDRVGFITVQLVGILGWFDVKLPYITIISYFIIVFLVALYDKSGLAININIKQKIYFVTVFFIYLFLLYVLFFFISSPGSKIIHGVQGRYFIPFYPILLILLYNNKYIIKEIWIKFAVLSISVITLFTSAVCLFERYYHI